MKSILITLVLWSSVCVGDIIPSTNRITWSAGVLGGIPTVATGVNVMDYGAVADGVTDDYVAVSNAIRHCPTTQAVYFPGGTYKIGSVITIGSGGLTNRYVLRGAGSTQTTLLISAGANGSIYFPAGSTAGSNTLASGYTKGSTQVIANATTGLAVGQQCEIGQTNDYTAVGNIPSSINYMTQGNQITGISGNTITLLTPLHWTFDATNTPFIKTWASYVTNSGVENMKLIVSGSALAGIYMWKAMDCWVTGCEITNYTGQSGILLDEAYRCEVRTNILHSYMTAGSRYGANATHGATDCLFEDNITGLTSSGIVIQFEANGCVVAYNYYYKSWDQSTLAFSFHGHGGNATWNLFEGNVGNGAMGVDTTWGSNPRNTFVRNWATASSPGATSVRYGILLDTPNYYENVVGNILVLPSDGGASLGNPVPLKIGADANILATAIIDGNYEFRTNTLVSAWADHSIPSSYYLSGKPSWFGNLAWPPIGPDICTNNGITNNILIPAQARYLGISFPYTNFPVLSINGTLSAGSIRSQ